MELTGERLLPVPREKVWAALLDPETLRVAIPGCESVVEEGSGRYLATVAIAIGPVKARFKGKLYQQDLQPPTRYTLAFEGDGGMAGFSKGTAAVDLAEVEVDGKPGTRLTYVANAQIGGRLAQIGSRLIDATAAKLSDQFFERLAKVLTEGLPSTATAAPAQGSIEPTQEPLDAPTIASSTPGAAVSVGAPVAAGSVLGSNPSMVTIQMPAWTWAFTVTVLALLAGWVTVY